MAEAIGLSSAVLTLASAAYKSCQTLHNAVDGFRSAHEQMLALSSDLEAFYLVLGSLQTVLQDEMSAPVAVDHIMSSGLSKVLDGSMEIFKKLTAIAASLRGQQNSASAGTLKKAKWTLKEKAIAELRNELMQCKITLNIAICVANEYNLRAARASMSKIESDIQGMNAATAHLERDMLDHLQELRSELQSKLPSILQQQENVLALRLLEPSRHLEEDRDNVRTDFGYTIRHFVDSTASTKSNFTPCTPSFRVSTFEATSSAQPSSYHTTPESQGVPSIERGVHGHIQVFVRNAGIAKTLVFQLDSESTIENLKDQIRDRIDLPDAQFVLVHAGKLIRQGDKILREYGVLHDATFTCVSFLPRPSIPEQSSYTINVTVKNLQGEEMRCLVSSQYDVRKLKCFYANKQGKGRLAEISADAVDPMDPHNIDIVYKCRALADDTCITDTQLTTEDDDWVSNRGDWFFHALMSPDAVRPAPNPGDSQTSPMIHEQSLWKKPFWFPLVRSKRLYYGAMRVPYR